MSSSEQFPDWGSFSEREVPLEVSDFLSPALEIGALIQRQEAALRKERQEAEHAQHALRLALAQQAVLVYSFEIMLHDMEASLTQSGLAKVYRTLRIKKDQMLDALHEAGLEIESPLGQPYHQVANRVDIMPGWLHSKEFATEVVAEVLEPIVLYRSKPIRYGRVIMGAPPAEDQDRDTPDA